MHKKDSTENDQGFDKSRGSFLWSKEYIGDYMGSDCENQVEITSSLQPCQHDNITH